MTQEDTDGREKKPRSIRTTTEAPTGGAPKAIGKICNSRMQQQPRFRCLLLILRANKGYHSQVFSARREINRSETRTSCQRPGKKKKRRAMLWRVSRCNGVFPK